MKAWVIALILIVVAAAIGYAGWRVLDAPPDCYACARPIHADSMTEAVVDGHLRRFCCPACALSQREQSGNRVRVSRLTSFPSGKPIAPDAAYIVRGSALNMCAKAQELINEDARTAPLRYDRCSPSVIAFASRDEALRFAAARGGEVVQFKGLK